MNGSSEHALSAYRNRHARAAAAASQRAPILLLLFQVKLILTLAHWVFEKNEMTKTEILAK